MKNIFWITALLIPASAQAWEVDLSRRQDQMGSRQNEQVTAAALEGVAADRSPASLKMPEKAPEKNIFSRVFDTVLPTQDIVIINTDQGFVPSTVRVKEGAQYRIVVVNVNEKARNVSFVLDAFSEHHATFYGQMKTFYISPKKEGVYTFLSPETSAQGRLVVHPVSGPQSVPPLETRSPASE